MSVDLSDQAITARLRRVEQLRRLCLSLGKAELLAAPPHTVNKEQLNGEDKETGATPCYATIHQTIEGGTTS